MASLKEPRFFAYAVLAAFAFQSAAAEERLHDCYSMAQARHLIIAHRLAEPFASMWAAARQMRADPIGAKLCQIGDGFFYEVSLLRHDGLVMRVLVDAETGTVHAPPPAHGAEDAAPKGDASAPARR